MRYVKKRGIILLCTLVSMLAMGCSSLQEKETSGYLFESYGFKTHQIQQSVLHKLYHQHEEWQGVRYKLGGLNKNGVDCSGLVYLTYKSKLGIHLPRTAQQQSKLGQEIYRHELKAGDLVFFRTGPTSKHVGIYLENKKFLHASQSKGVIISHLDNTYWKAKYWKSIRI